MLGQLLAQPPQVGLDPRANRHVLEGQFGAGQQLFILGTFGGSGRVGCQRMLGKSEGGKADG